MKLSLRLGRIASFVNRGSKIADIGTDHGYIPIFLVKEGIIPSALAMDVRSGPLERARTHIEAYGLTGQIETRLSDGLKALVPGEADTVVIAGMGGELILHILEEGRAMWSSVRQWVLSPQSEIDKVRRYLEVQGFRIEREDMVCEDGKYYPIMSVVPGKGDSVREMDFYFGRRLIEKKDAVLAEFLCREFDLYSGILEKMRTQATEVARDREAELSEMLRRIEEAQDEMQ